MRSPAPGLTFGRYAKSRARTQSTVTRHRSGSRLPAVNFRRRSVQRRQPNLGPYGGNATCYLASSFTTRSGSTVVLTGSPSTSVPVTVSPRAGTRTPRLWLRIRSCEQSRTSPLNEVPPGRSDDRDPSDPRPLLVIPDSIGVHTWQAMRRARYGRDCVALVSRQTPAQYLDYLASHQVQPLVHSEDHIDVRAPFEELSCRFGVRTVPRRQRRHADWCPASSAPGA